MTKSLTLALLISLFSLLNLGDTFLSNSGTNQARFSQSTADSGNSGDLKP